MSNMNEIAEKIAVARREAESLKEKIKARKDALSDTTRKYHIYHNVIGERKGGWG
jgi:predicted DNA-binding protein YlxM (UPF0122 family)